ncbi:MAG: EamA family transporter [Saprospiraceae bacterium]
MNSGLSFKSKLIFAFAAIYLVWGSNFIIVQHVLKSFPPFLLSSMRLCIAGMSLLVVCFIRKEPFPSKQEIYKNALTGIVIFIGGIVAVVWAQQYLSSSMTAIIITTPFWFVILDRRQWHYYFSSYWIVSGLLLGLLGVFLLAQSKHGSSSTVSSPMEFIAILTIITGSFMWVAGSLYLKYHPTASSVYVNTTIQLLTAGIVCLPFSFLNGDADHFILDQIPWNAWLGLIYLAIVSSCITFLAFMWLIRVQPPAVVSTYAYVNPLVATLLGWFIANEKISLLQISALAIILIGLFFVNMPRYKWAVK